VSVKACQECHRELPIGQFYKDSSKPDGHFAWCKRCVNCGVTRDPTRYGCEPLAGDPSPQLIAIQCAKLQSSWSASERARRTRGRVLK
jgi:hypothetical protein